VSATHVADGLPVVLFLCVHNAGRSQMALGWFDHLADDRAIAWSGGSEPAKLVNPAAIAAMAEVGIDISEEFPKPWTEEIVRAADVVVTMPAATPAPASRGSATRTGCWPTLSGRASKRCARCGTRSAGGSKTFSPAWASPRLRRADGRRVRVRRTVAQCSPTVPVCVS